MLALLVNFAATWFMAGLIWLVQVVHYPQFSLVGAEGWGEYHRLHSRNVTFIVGPVMLIELATAAWLVVRRPEAVPAWVAPAGLVMVGLLWASTAFLQVPRHNQLAGGFDAPAHGALVATNWVRTVLWTGRGLLMGYALWCVLRE